MTYIPPDHLIGQEWIEHGYESYSMPDEPDPCPIDGTPFNACTHSEADIYDYQKSPYIIQGGINPNTDTFYVGRTH